VELARTLVTATVIFVSGELRSRRRRKRRRYRPTSSEPLPLLPSLSSPVEGAGTGSPWCSRRGGGRSRV
jgi:hypothetical protein